MIRSELMGCEAPLTEVRQATHAPQRGLSASYRGGQGAGENKDNRDDDQKLKEGEPRPSVGGVG